MGAPTILVVGLGPGDIDCVTEGARRALTTAPVARLRTRVHPSAAAFAEIASYDHLYETAEDFASLYDAIVEDLVALAHAASDHRVVYGVPGSPMVAERTVELLCARDDVTVEVQPAVSVIDVACARMAVDPMGRGLRIADAMADEPVRGPGPLLILQVHAPEVAAVLADRLAPETRVTVLHHLGLADEVVQPCAARELAGFAVDHLTSVWVDEVATAGSAMDDLASLATRLRRDCVWDAEQTTDSLARHLLEEAYEALDALGAYASDPARSAHAIEELGDLLYQVVAQTEVAREAGDFTLVDVITAVTAKLVDRHPHVFGVAVVADARAAAAQWEQIKKKEKGRASATDGVPASLPSLVLYEKMRLQGDAVGLAPVAWDESHRRLVAAAHDLAAAPTDGTDAWIALARAIGDVAHVAHVNLESVARAAALHVRDEVIAHEHRVIDSGGVGE